MQPGPTPPKKVTFAVHANRMKPFIDPSLRPIDSPAFDDPSEPYLDESDIPEDCFLKEQAVDSNDVSSEKIQVSEASQTPAFRSDNR